MRLDEIIKSENTDGQFERWMDYRNALTDIIEATMTTELCGTNDDSAVMGVKPTLAIWGAGGCNDIDIKRLSKSAKLVLIDREKDRTERAIEMYGLDKSQAVACDLFFYDIPYECYEHWEELLYTGTAPDVLHTFLSELLLEAVSTDMLMLPEFDYSVAVGISSQLNSRLAALLYLYRDKYSTKDREEILKHIAIMDREAVRRLCDMVHRTTLRSIVWGYEKSITGTDDTLNIEGNNRFRELILAEKDRILTGSELLVWPFTAEKSYDMQIVVTG
jgi:hypothetical protein